MNSRTRSEPLKRIIKLSSRVVVAPRSTQQIQVAFAGELPIDRDLLFKPQYTLQLSHSSGIYTYVVNASFQTV